MLTRVLFAIALLSGALVGCGPAAPRQPEVIEPSATAQMLTFEDRMAIPARLTVIKSEAKEEATAEYDRFASREEAVAWETKVARLEAEKRQALLDEYGITEQDLVLIVDEYLNAQGVEIREE